MPIFKPFRAFRPVASEAKKMASRPFDVVRQGEADSENEEGLSQFLKVTKPEMFDKALTASECYEASKTALDGFIRDAVLKQDEKDCFYLYGQTIEDHSQYGIIGCLSTDDYKNGLIKQHELTQVDKVADRVNHILKTGFHTEPVFTAVKDNLDLDLIIQDTLLVDPEYNFVTSDGVTHQFWPIVNEAKLRRLQYVFEHDISSVYIADGHHRSAAANIVANELKSDVAKLFPVAVFPMKQLKLKGYHRLVALGDLSVSDLLEKLSISFAVVGTEGRPVFPSDQENIGLFVGGRWYKLSIPDKFDKVIDVASLFNDAIVRDVFGIKDVRTTARIEYFGSQKQVNNLVEDERLVDGKAFFTLCPLDMSLLFKLSDEGCILPPKSTWFEPKLRSGLFLHSFIN